MKWIPTSRQKPLLSIRNACKKTLRSFRKVLTTATLGPNQVCYFELTYLFAYCFAAKVIQDLDSDKQPDPMDVDCTEDVLDAAGMYGFHTNTASFVELVFQLMILPLMKTRMILPPTRILNWTNSTLNFLRTTLSLVWTFSTRTKTFLTRKKTEAS